MNIEQGKSHWSDEELDQLRASIRELQTSQGLNQAKIAKESAVAEATVSQFLSDKYKGDNQRVAKDLARWLTAKREEIQVTSAAPPQPTFVRTSIAERVIGVLRTAHILSDIGVVTGPAGCGKTAAARQYQATTPRVAIATGAPKIRSASAILQELLRSRGEIPRGRVACSGLELTLYARRTFTAGCLMVIDEAQLVDIEALEEIRAIHDETGCGVVLMGNETVLSRIEGTERAAGYAQLYSRAGIRQRLSGAPATDIEAVMATMAVTDPAVIKVATAIGDKDSLRVVVKALRRAQMIASGDRETLNPDHLRLAYRQLGGALARAA